MKSKSEWKMARKKCSSEYVRKLEQNSVRIFVQPPISSNIRSRVADPDSIGSVDPDPYPYSESGSGSRRAKMTQKSRKN
jgi:hypothetical protein